MSEEKSKAELRGEVEEELFTLTEKIVSHTEYDINTYRALCKELAKRNPFKDGTVIIPTDSRIALKYLEELDDGCIHVMCSLSAKWWKVKIKGTDWTELASFNHKMFSIAVWGAYLEWSYYSERDLYE